MAGRMKVAVVAGEASGDILGAGLIRALRQSNPDLEVRGIGGELMQAEGCHSLYPMERLSVMGLVEVLGRLRELLKIRKSLTQQLTGWQPDVFIGIDAPDFTLNLEGKLRSAGIPTVHYVSPSVWAWRSKRVFKILDTTDLMLTLLPFEARFYEQHNMPVRFVGHPLANMIDLEPDQAEARCQLGISEGEQLIAVMPGSRGGELKYLARPFLDTVRWLLERNPDLRFILPAANQTRFDTLQALLQSEYKDLPVRLHLKESRLVMQASDAILMASGTVTLEAMLLKKPMVVAYKMASLTYRILSRLVKSPYISLPNLLAGEKLVPEVLQNDVRPEILGPLVEKALQDSEQHGPMTQRFHQLHLELRQDADQRAAEAVLQLVADKRGEA